MSDSAKINQTALLDEADIMGMIRTRCRQATQKHFAESCGVSPQYISDVLRQNRQPGDSILAALGVHKVIRYQQAGAQK